MKIFIAMLPVLLLLAYSVYEVFKTTIEDHGWWFFLSSIGAAVIVIAWIMFWIKL
jgi:hypothetical protein